MRKKIWDLLMQQGKIDSSHTPVDESFITALNRLIANKVVMPADIYEAYARSMQLQVIKTIDCSTLPQVLLEQIPYAFAKVDLFLPLSENQNVIVVVFANPFNVAAVDSLHFLFPGRTIEIAYADEELILRAQEHCYQKHQGAASQLISDIEHTLAAGSGTKIEALQVDDLLDPQQTQSPIVNLVHLILTEAISQGASDVHIEPFEKCLKIRYRIDGILLTRHTTSHEHQQQIATRFKVMAQLDVAESRLPQDGRVKLTFGARQVDLRLSFIPVVHGERVVIRILDCNSLRLGLNCLGMDVSILQAFRKIIHRPTGIILVTGPTGSGKTTTLYSAVMEIDKESLNIMTIEDPVEYKLAGIAQMGVHHKIHLDFAAGLRHILRQDPDVIMIGEIRDLETAQIAIQAALTGHLVLSTLHTNDAASAITRLVEMGIEPYLLSSSMIAVLAQRLLRKICAHCKQESTMQKKCSHCYGVGYRGRTGIYELMQISSSVQKAMLQQADASQLKMLAVQEGMVGLHEQGMRLVESGATTKEELLRVLGG